MNDYKYEIFLMVEEIAEEKYGKSFYELGSIQQTQVYGEGMQCYVERQVP